MNWPTAFATRRAKQLWSGTCKSLAVGLCVFYLGRELAVWLAAHHVHEVLAFLDNIMAGVAAGIVVLLYERRRQRVIDKLRESEERFRLVSNAAPALIWMSDTDKLCTYFNKTWLDFTGRSLEQELGNGWTEGLHAEDLHRRLDTYKPFFDQRETFRMEYRLRRYDGEYRWILDIGVPRFNQDGSFAGYIGIAVDVTERKLSEQQRLLSENRFRQFFETMPEYCYLVSPKGEIVDANLAACSAFGYTKDELVGKPLSTFYAPECHPKMRELFTRWKADGKLRNEEMMVITKQGQRRTVLLNVGSVKDFDGTILHSTSVQVDITERKMAEEKLRESEEQFRTLAEAIPQLCWMANPDGYIFWYNRRWHEYTGTTPEQMAGWGWQSVHDPQTLPAVLERWKNSIATATPFDMIFPLKRADGAFRSFLTRIVPLKDADGKIVRWFGTNTDVTELREAQEALQRSEERLRLSQHAASIASFDWNIQTGVNTWSPELEAMYGLPSGSFSQRQSGFENLAHPDDREEVMKLVDWALKSRQATEGQWRVIWPDGSVHWLAGRWQVLNDESGQPVRMIGVNMDVTERKIAEDALANFRRRLIEAQEEERCRIARELHDDINQQVALIIMKLAQCEQHLSDHDVEIRDPIRDVRERLGHLGKDVQALSHRLHSSKLDYLGLAPAARSLCREISEQHKVDINFSEAGIPRSLPRQISISLFRVLQEALQNAIKYSGARHFTVEIRARSGTIELVVRDRGVGFDPQAAMKHQGLGLISMRERMQSVNGELSIDSQPGKGTTVKAGVPFVGEADTSAMREAAG